MYTLLEMVIVMPTNELQQKQPTILIITWLTSSAALHNQLIHFNRTVSVEVIYNLERNGTERRGFPGMNNITANIISFHSAPFLPLAWTTYT